MSRLFVAVDFDEVIKKHIIDDISPLFTPAMIKAKRTSADTMHLTLKFIGERKDDDINDIIDILSKSQENIHAFDIQVKGVGAFPKQNNPRIIWIGIISEQLSRLASNIDNNLTKIGISSDNKPFSPHITLYRVKEVHKNKDVNDVIESLKNVDIGIQHVTSFKLMKSTLTPSGPIYTTIKEFTL